MGFYIFGLILRCTDVQYPCSEVRTKQALLRC